MILFKTKINIHNLWHLYKKREVSAVLIIVLTSHYSGNVTRPWRSCAIQMQIIGGKSTAWTFLTMFLLPFWALKVARMLLPMWVRNLQDFIKNIFICDPKMNKDLTGLEQHVGE